MIGEVESTKDEAGVDADAAAATTVLKAEAELL